MNHLMNFNWSDECASVLCIIFLQLIQYVYLIGQLVGEEQKIRTNANDRSLN